MKKVFNKEMVCHVWANQSQDEGRTPTGNLYFNGATLYSYGSHFIIGKFITNKRNDRAVLFNSNRYSVTTSAHQHLARFAVSGVLTIEVNYIANSDYDLLSQHTSNKKHWLSEIEYIKDKLPRARARKDEHIQAIVRLVNDANIYATFYGLRWVLKVPEFTPEALEAVKVRQQKVIARQKKRNLAHQKAIARKQKEAVKQYLNLEINRIPYELRGGLNVLLRVNGEVVQTSEGAEVPVSHARKLFPHVKKCHDNGTTFEANGHKIPVGHFEVRRIESSGNVQIGCHYIVWSEVERISQELGL